MVAHQKRGGEPCVATGPLVLGGGVFVAAEAGSADAHHTGQHWTEKLGLLSLGTLVTVAGALF
jgi:hypothetical protein